MPSERGSCGGAGTARPAETARFRQTGYVRRAFVSGLRHGGSVDVDGCARQLVAALHDGRERSSRTIRCCRASRPTAVVICSHARVASSFTLLHRTLCRQRCRHCDPAGLAPGRRTATATDAGSGPHRIRRRPSRRGDGRWRRPPNDRARSKRPVGSFFRAVAASGIRSLSRFGRHNRGCDMHLLRPTNRIGRIRMARMAVSSPDGTIHAFGVPAGRIRPTTSCASNACDTRSTRPSPVCATSAVAVGCNVLRTGSARSCSQ